MSRQSTASKLASGIGIAVTLPGCSIRFGRVRSDVRSKAVSTPTISASVHSAAPPEPEPTSSTRMPGLPAVLEQREHRPVAERRIQRV